MSRNQGVFTMAKFQDVVERAETIRKRMGLNKTEFSARIGIKPQTYNNYVGAQGSKPNLDLVIGIIKAFNVDPNWLLEGAGSATSRSRREGDDEPGSQREEIAEAHFRRVYDASKIAALRRELELVLAPVRSDATPLLRRTSYRNAHVAYALQVIVHFFCVSPAATAAQVVEMLEEFGRLAEQMEWVARRDRNSNRANHTGK